MLLNPSPNALGTKTCKVSPAWLTLPGIVPYFFVQPPNNPSVVTSYLFNVKTLRLVATGV
jgi:hypothetical protein